MSALKRLRYQLFSISHRLNRRQFFLLVLCWYIINTAIQMVAFFVVYLALNAQFGSEGELETMANLIFSVVSIALSPLLISILIRRGFDMGVPLLLTIIFMFAPIANFALVLALFLLPSMKGGATFGPAPLNRWTVSEVQIQTGLEFFDTARNKASKDETILDLTNLLGLLAKFAKADGRMGKEELTLINDFLKIGLGLIGDDLKNGREMFSKFKNSQLGFDHFSAQFATIHKGNKSLLISTHDLLIDVAKADGKITINEVNFLRIAANDFELHDRVDVEYSDWGRTYTDPQEEKFDQAHSADTISLEVFFGLDKSASDTEIKSAYRKMCKEYHPDLVRNMGPKIQQLASEEMRKINTKYEQLKEQRGFS